MKKAVIMGGGTFSPVRSHLSLCAPAFGETARHLAGLAKSSSDWETHLMLTKMADHNSKLMTNDDVARYVDGLLLQPEVRMIIFNVALCDYSGDVGYVASGAHATRLKTAEGNQLMTLRPAEKIIKRIRKTRKDIFLVAFKTTTDATEDEQYLAGLNLLKANSCNLVLANDTVTRKNMIIVPEEARYCVTTNRRDALEQLWIMAEARSNLTFTRSTVVPGELLAWSDEAIPHSLKEVVDYCISKGAYKPFRGATAGHFAFKADDHTFFTSVRKDNYNFLPDRGLVKIESSGLDSVIAYGAKPSVGGQSQRIVFSEHPEFDCIVHFHSPPRQGKHVPTRSQKLYECGSHECGANTSAGLELVDDGIKAVYLDNHGPNIVFKRDADPKKVINFIEENFDLADKTGGLVTA